jgi:glyoxylase I family protein
LLERARLHLVKLAAAGGLVLRQNYNREAPRLAGHAGRYGHAKQYQRMRASLKNLKTCNVFYHSHHAKHDHPQGELMIHIREIDHIVLRVVDLAAMERFYCHVLGCKVERRQEEIGLIQLRAGRCLLDLVPVDGKLGRMGGAAPGADGHNVDHICFRVEPFDAAAIRGELAAAGVEAGPVESRYGAEGEGPSIYLNDPEGNTVELKGPAWS